MTYSDPIADALADLHDAVASGREINESISDIADDYGINSEILRSRALRAGGIIESAERLKSRMSLISELNTFEREELLFGYPLPDFIAWRKARGLSELSPTDAAFVPNEIKTRRERAQQVFHNKALMEISRGRSDAED